MLTAIPGIRVGHGTDAVGCTGCTVILCPDGTVGGVDIRGSAAGTREMDALSPLHLVPFVHAVLLAGGSAFGLDAAGGVMRYLEERGVGFRRPGHAGAHRPRRDPVRSAPGRRGGPAGRAHGLRRVSAGNRRPLPGRLRRRGDGGHGGEAVRHIPGDEIRSRIGRAGSTGRRARGGTGRGQCLRRRPRSRHRRSPGGGAGGTGESSPCEYRRVHAPRRPPPRLPAGQHDLGRGRDQRPPDQAPGDQAGPDGATRPGTRGLPCPHHPGRRPGHRPGDRRRSRRR